MTAIAEATAPYALDAEQGVTDLWWPYCPAVGRYIVKAAASRLADGWCRWSCAIRVGRARRSTPISTPTSRST